jgi:hypothetical protein
LIGSSGVSGPFGSGWGASGGLGPGWSGGLGWGCSGGLGAGTSTVSGIIVGDKFGFLLLGYERSTRSNGGFNQMATAETGQVTGTKDKTYNIIWFTEACLDNVLRLEQYIQDAERDNDPELAEFFRKAQAESRKGAEQGKQLLKPRLDS